MKKVFAMILVLCMLICDSACAGYWADDVWIEDAWVLCQKGSLVNIREKPSKSSSVIPSLMECGSEIHLDGKKKGSWLHCVNLSLEEDEGWIYEGYVTSREPVLVEKEAYIKSNGRVAARKSVGGDRVKWLKPNQKVTVQYFSGDWCITNFGYVQGEYIEFVEE